MHRKRLVSLISGVAVVVGAIALGVSSFNCTEAPFKPGSEPPLAKQMYGEWIWDQWCDQGGECTLFDSTQPERRYGFSSDSVFCLWIDGDLRKSGDVEWDTIPAHIFDLGPETDSVLAFALIGRTGISNSGVPTVAYDPQFLGTDTLILLSTSGYELRLIRVNDLCDCCQRTWDR